MGNAGAGMEHSGANGAAAVGGGVHDGGGGGGRTTVVVVVWRRIGAVVACGGSGQWEDTGALKRWWGVQRPTSGGSGLWGTAGQAGVAGRGLHAAI